MASGYTANYGLCQWQPTDKFLREEFNQDNEKIDAAIKAVKDSATAVGVSAQTAAEKAQETADRALSDLGTVSYNVYNLALQQSYEDKVTGWKQAMLFDGFQDDSGIASLGSGLVLNNGVVLSKSISSNQEVANGTSYQYSTSSLDTAAAVSAPGGAYLYRIKCVWKAETDYQVGDQSLGFSFYVNGVLHHSETHSLYFSTTQQEGYINLTTTIPVTTGDQVHFTCSLGSHFKMPIVRNSNQLIYAVYVFKPTNLTFASVITKDATLPAAKEAWLWLRHIGGSIDPTLRTNGTARGFALQSSRSTVDPKGRSCTEKAYHLTANLPAGTTSLMLKLQLSSDQKVTMLDYGLVLL